VVRGLPDVPPQPVDLLDGLLALMESDPSYRRFLLDGRWPWSNDYLEIRPERPDGFAPWRRRSAHHGPWYILMDEFLVSGETIIRNLQLGLARGGVRGAMDVGYLPDMFGHIAQMPSCCGSPASATRWCGAACPRRSRRRGSAGAPTDRRYGRVPARRVRQCGVPA